MSGQVLRTRRVSIKQGAQPMTDGSLMFLLIVASLGVGGVLGLIALVAMAIEIKREGY